MMGRCIYSFAKWVFAGDWDINDHNGNGVADIIGP